MTQSKDDLEKFYSESDPWGFKTNIDDLFRKSRIIEIAKKYGPYKSALDIGCGEGFITTELPAEFISGYEISDLASSRIPSNVLKCKNPFGKYDLVVATGVFYPQYDVDNLIHIVKEHTGRIFLTSNIKEMEAPELTKAFDGKQIYEEEFKYRQYVQKLRVYELGK